MKRFALRVCVGSALVLLLLPAGRAWAVREWYDYYQDAEDLIAKGRCKEAIESLQQAVKLKPNSGLNEQKYGNWFVEYLPYYQMATCQLRLGNLEQAQDLLRQEEAHGAIRKSTEYTKRMQQLHNEVDKQQRLVMAKSARAEAQELLKGSEEYAKAGKLEQALVQLAKAEGLAKSLQDAQLQQDITERATHIQHEQKRQGEETERSTRLGQLLNDGRRLLEDGKATEARIKFDEALKLDARSSGALEGRRQADESIQASATHAQLEDQLAEGRRLFKLQKYEEALGPLTQAAADKGLPEAESMRAEAQKMVEGLRTERTLRERLDKLNADGKHLLEQRRFPEAQVVFERALALDPGNIVLKDMASLAEERTGQSILERYFPNDAPQLEIIQPEALESEVESPNVSVVGVAFDERGLAQVEIKVNGRIAATIPAQVAALGGLARKASFSQVFPLQEGPNEIVVIARDSAGLERPATYRLTRRPRFFERRMFWPASIASAGGFVGLGLAVQGLRRRRARRRRFNPYIAGAPVMDADMFFGRQKLMARILSVLHHNSLMITGERRIGKTTFLYHLRRALEGDVASEYRFFPVSIDLQGVPEESFFHALMADIVDSLALEPDTLGSLRFRTEPLRYDGRDFSHDLQRVIDELKTRTPKNVKLALLIDEADVLNEYSERVNQRLRSIFMKTFSEHLVAIMSGVGVRRIWKSEGSPWYNFFDEVELEPLARTEAEALIREPVEGVFRYANEAVEAILEESELKPYIIQKFCIHAVSHMIENGRSLVTLEDVRAVRDQVRHEGREIEPRLSPAV
jgi:tetratricopeptide (TPR) repeat protein